MVDPHAQTALSGDGTPHAPDVSAGVEAGQLVGMRYRLVDRLGGGAMGEVWRAQHEELRTELAVKIARVDEHDRDRLLERFRFEAQVSAQLSQRTRHIVAVYDAGTVGGAPYMAMELVRGESLGDIVDREVLPLRQVADVVDQLADALEVAHTAGIWHRDLKPDNVMVSPQPDGSWLVKLADFGVSKAMHDQLDVEAPRTTTQGMLVGTPHYMSPQQLEGAPPDARGDLWSLAVLTYELLTGRMPFEGDSLTHLITSIITRPPVAVRTLRPSAGVADAWFARALHKDPDRRFDSAAEMARAFRDLVDDDDEWVPPVALPRRSPFGWIAAAVAVLLVGGVGSFVALADRPPATADEMQDESVPVRPDPPPREEPVGDASPPVPTSTSAEAPPTQTASASVRQVVPPPVAPTLVAPPPGPSPRPKPYDPSETF